MPSFAERLKSLGFSSYQDYLASDHWQGIRRSYRKSNRPKVCVCCSNPKYQLHHKTYSRLGCEKLNDLIPLCEVCHTKTHEVVKSRKVPLHQAHLHVSVNVHIHLHLHEPKQKRNKKSNNSPVEVTQRIEDITSELVLLKLTKRQSKAVQSAVARGNLRELQGLLKSAQKSHPVSVASPHEAHVAAFFLNQLFKMVLTNKQWNTVKSHCSDVKQLKNLIKCYQRQNKQSVPLQPPKKVEKGSHPLGFVRYLLQGGYH